MRVDGHGDALQLALVVVLGRAAPAAHDAPGARIYVHVLLRISKFMLVRAFCKFFLGLFNNGCDTKLIMLGRSIDNNIKDAG